jgi:S-adenosylmethionine decarboxylase
MVPEPDPEVTSQWHRWPFCFISGAWRPGWFNLLVGEGPKMSQQALFQSGMDLAHPSTARTEGFLGLTDGVYKPYEPEVAKDHFVVKNGVECAGTHLIIDLMGASRLTDIAHIDRALRDCVDAAGATLLHIHLHHFTPNAGVSGVAVLAESHISIHTWPERGYAALDVFMCGAARPERCVEVLRHAFRPTELRVRELLRGEGA